MSLAEQHEIINWFLKTSQDPKYRLFGGRVHLALNEKDYSIPRAIFTIKQRIIQKERLQGHIQEPVFKDFCAAILQGGFIHPHTDTNMTHLIHARFNVFISNPNDGLYMTYYRGYPVEEKERHYTLCRSGMDLHWSTRNMNETPRIVLSFGFLLPQRKLDTLVNPLPVTFLQYIHYILMILYSNATILLCDIPVVGSYIYKKWIGKAPEGAHAPVLPILTGKPVRHGSTSAYAPVEPSLTAKPARHARTDA